jgi:hypothetical protein
MTPALKRTMLLGFLAAIAAAALCGIWVLVFGQFGWIEERVLATAGIVAAASVLSLAGAAAWEARRWFPIGPLAMATVAAAAVLVLTLLWLDFFAETGWRAAIILTVVATALAHTAMLALARLRRAHEWVRLATVTVIGLLVIIVCALVLTEFKHADEVYRAVGVLAILDGAGTITVPVLHRLGGVEAQSRRDTMVTAARSVSITCPRCGTRQAAPLGRSACRQCRLVITIEIEEEHCPACGYVVFGLRGDVCPECGASLGVKAPDHVSDGAKPKTTGSTQG